MKLKALDIPVVLRAALSIIPVMVLVRVTPLLYDFLESLLHPPVRRYHVAGIRAMRFAVPGFLAFAALLSAIGLFAVWRGVKFSVRGERS